MVDCAIHSGYKIYPVNYIAFDKLNHTDQFSDKYTAEDIEKFDSYMTSQLGKTDIPELTDDDKEYLYRMMLTMYANPLRNNISAATSCEDTEK